MEGLNAMFNILYIIKPPLLKDLESSSEMVNDLKAFFEINKGSSGPLFPWDSFRASTVQGDLCLNSQFN